MDSIKYSNDLKQSVEIEHIFSDEQGATLQEIMEYLIKILIENNSLH